MRRATADPVKARVRQMHATLKRRAGAQPVMNLNEFRAHYDEMMTRPLCFYCNAALSEENVSLDHYKPAARGGGHGTDNLVFCCRFCNKAKGRMSGFEFVLLLAALDKVSQRAANPYLRGEILQTLQCGNSFRIGANRRVKR